MRRLWASLRSLLIGAIFVLGLLPSARATPTALPAPFTGGVVLAQAMLPAANSSAAQRWTLLRGGVTALAVAMEGDVFVLDGSGSVWRMVSADVQAGRWDRWAPEPGNFVRLASSLDGSVWGVDRGNTLFRRTSSGWWKFADNVLDVAAGPEGDVTLLLSNGQLVQPDRVTFQPWPLAAGKPVRLVADPHGFDWLLYDSGQVLRREGQAWRLMELPPGGLRALTTGADGTVLGADSTGQMLQFVPESGSWVAYRTAPVGTWSVQTPAVGLRGSTWVLTSDGSIWVDRTQTAANTATVAPPSTFTRLLRWRNAGGGPSSAVAVGVDGGVFSLGVDGSPWEWGRNQRWTSVPGKFRAIAAGSGRKLWGLTEGGQVMGWNGSLWSETPGTFRAIGSDGRDAVWAAGTDDGLYRWASPARQWQAATVLPRDVRGLAVGPGDVPWVLTAQGQVQVFRSGAWSDIPGVVASSIAVGPEGTVYATDARDQSIFWLDPRERSWKPATGKATSMAVGPGGAPWAIGPGNTLMASEQFLRDDEAGVTAAAAASTPPASGQPASGMTITPGPLPALQSVLSFRSLGVAAVGFQALGIGGNGAVFGVSSAGNLFCFSNQSQRFLLASTGRASRVAVTADGLPWLLNASGVVSRFEKGAWTLVPEFLGREISVSPDGGVWALDVQGNPYRYARSSNRFERLVVTASDAPVKARRIAGANGGAYWLVTEANQLSWCDKGTCKTQLIGVQDVGVAPDNTAYVLDLLGSVRRFNPRTREFERQNGVGVAMAVGPQGLPWLVTRDGDVSIAGLFNPTSRSVNTDACAAPFSVAPAPVEPVTAQFRVPDISATAAPGGVVQILGQSTFNGRPVALADVSIVFSASTPLLTLRDGLVRIDPAAAPGSQLQATFNVCPARAVGACASAKLSVAVGIVPVAPTGVVATLGNARASISFNPPSDSGGSPVTGYIVTTSPGGLTATGVTSPIVIQGLTNGVAYTFTVRAINAIGQGPASAPSATVTPATTPDAPTAARAIGGNRQATISFAAPASNGGTAITGYLVTSSPGGVTASGVTSPVVVTGLANGTAYTFTVRAVSALGLGPASAASGPVTPATIPGAPTSVAAVPGNGQVSVSFAAPADNGGSPVTAYTVSASPGTLTASGPASPIVIPGLSNGVSYRFTVQAVNAIGSGPASAASAPVTPLTAAGAPTSVTAVPGDGHAVVNFASPASSGGSPVTGYVATSSPGGITASGILAPVTVVGLTNGTTYSFTVRALTAVGLGTASQASNAVVPAGLPGAPTGVVPAAGNGQASVAFTAPANNGGSAITSYIVTSSPGGFTASAAASPMVVTGLSNGTAYSFTVRAVNAVGTGAASAASVAVTPVAPTSTPGAPTGVSATAGNAQASVAFTAPASNGGSAITSYIVTSSPGGISASGTASPIVVNGLTNGTAYTFTVRAVNANGSGAASAASTAVTPGTTPGAPTGVSATAGNAQASVAFTAPVSNGGSAITSYIVTSSPGGLTASGGASPMVITGLTNGSAYSFTVRAVNAVGAGPASAASVAVTPVAPTSTPGAPTGVSATAGNAQASVAFTAPASNGGSAITSYLVTSSPGGITASGTASPIVVNGLTNGTAYSFTVQAVNANGTGVASAASAAVTPATTPGAPTGVTATASNAQASVAFTVPASNGGSAITSYIVTSSPGGITASGTASPIMVNGLTNGTAYTFTVRAVNANGSGAASAASTAVTPGTTPGAPTGVNATAGNAQASVAFTAPASNGGSAITSYIVTSSPGGISASGTASPIVVNGLTNGTAYTFTVRAVNANGTGAASAASTAVTPGTTPGAPTGVSATAVNAQASVAFTAPASNGGSAITSYIVTSSPGGLTASGTASPIVVSGLTNGTAYTFTVQAVNSNGTGAASAASTTVTPGTTPGAPTGVSATAGNAQASVAFTAPASNGGSAITSYLVASSPGGITASGTASPIVVNGLTNGTAYTFNVRAVNANGSGAASAASAAVTPATTPGAPTGVTATASNAQASVAFSAPASNGGSAITSYIVTSSPGGITASGTASPIMVNGLTNGTAYSFTVQAVNSNGTGAASVASTAVTPGTTPGAPTGVSATAGNAQASVAFTAPASNGGSAITSYLVTSSPGGITASGTASPIVVNGLTNGTAYSFTVQAVNTNGTGAASAASTTVTPGTTPGAPTGVTATAGNAQASVAFTAPASNGGSAITSYLVTSSPGGITASGTASPIVVNGLTNGTAYSFTVQAVNANGTGAASAASSSVTPATTPDAPTIASVSVNAAGAATLNVTAPASNGGAAITGYVASSTPAGFAVTTTTAATAISLGNYTTVSGGACTNYNVTVRATNSAGTGAASGSIRIGPAAAPTNVSAATGQSASSIVVSFTAPTDTGGMPLTNYQVTGTTANPQLPSLTATGSSSPITVDATQIPSGTDYTFTVQYQSAVCNGTTSAASGTYTVP
jgi:hypothetical protein